MALKVPLVTAIVAVGICMGISYMTQADQPGCDAACVKAGMQAQAAAFPAREACDVKRRMGVECTPGVGDTSNVAEHEKRAEIVFSLIVGGIGGGDAYFPSRMGAGFIEIPIKFDRLSEDQRDYLEQHCDAALPCVAHWTVAYSADDQKYPPLYHLIEWR